MNNGLVSFSLQVWNTSVQLQQMSVLSVTALHRDHAEVYLMSATAAGGKEELNREKPQ